MAEFTPQVIPLGSLADAAAASAELSQEEQQGVNSILDPGTTMGYMQP